MGKKPSFTTSNGFVTKALIFLVAFNFLTLLLINTLGTSSSSSSNGERNLQESDFPSIVIDDLDFDLDFDFSTVTSEEPVVTSYKFDNPALAYKVLSALDVFEPVAPKYLGIGTKPKNSYHLPFLGLKNDDEYCNKNREHFVYNPESVFEKRNYIVEVGTTGLLRQVVKEFDGDVMPHIGRHMPKKEKEQFLHDLDPSVNGYFVVLGAQTQKEVGRHMACLAQQYNHIPGHFSLNRKDTIAEGAIAYGNKFQDRPQCFSYDKYFPETWLLYNTTSCREFFKRVNTPEHKQLLDERKIVYIKKKAVGAHRGLGVTPLSADLEQELIAEYKNGQMCGKINAATIVQSYVHNALLLDGRKFDFRMYLMIGSSNPMMAFYHDGFLRVSLYEYDANSNDKRVTMTNLALNNDIYEDAKNGKLHHGMTEEDLKIAQQWSFERLQNYLLETGVISDPNWLDNYLRPEFKKAMIHLIRMSYHTFLQKSSLYEFYGVDFMLDSNLTLWFLEANSGPALGGYSIPMEVFIKKMLHDHFDIVAGLLKSRMKRVMVLVNKIINQGEAVENSEGEVVINGLENWREEFNKVSKNYFEPEFEVGSDNGWSKIMDYNYEGKERYMGLLDEACIDF